MRVRRGVSTAAATIMIVLHGCGDRRNDQGSNVADWLRAAAGVNETPELIECTEAAMRAELSEAQIREWLAHDPRTITVEELQALPHAIDIADRCRHLVPSGAP